MADTNFNYRALFEQFSVYKPDHLEVARNLVHFVKDHSVEYDTALQRYITEEMAFNKIRYDEWLNAYTRYKEQPWYVRIWMKKPIRPTSKSFAVAELLGHFGRNEAKRKAVAST